MQVSAGAPGVKRARTLDPRVPATYDPGTLQVQPAGTRSPIAIGPGSYPVLASQSGFYQKTTAVFQLIVRPFGNASYALPQAGSLVFIAKLPPSSKTEDMFRTERGRIEQFISKLGVDVPMGRYSHAAGFSEVALTLPLLNYLLAHASAEIYKSGAGEDQIVDRPAAGAVTEMANYVGVLVSERSQRKIMRDLRLGVYGGGEGAGDQNGSELLFNMASRGEAMVSAFMVGGGIGTRVYLLYRLTTYNELMSQLGEQPRFVFNRARPESSYPMPQALRDNPNRPFWVAMPWWSPSGQNPTFDNLSFSYNGRTHIGTYKYLGVVTQGTSRAHTRIDRARAAAMAALSVVYSDQANQVRMELAS